MTAAAYPKGVRNKVAYDLGTLLDDKIVPGSVAARHARSREPHVAALNEWAEAVARATGKKVPAFDARSGGTKARILLLLQDPSRVAQHGSRLISRDNNDPTAANTSLTMDRAGLDYVDVVPWNVVPWWVADPDLAVAGTPRTLTAESRLASPYLAQLLDLLPDIERILLVGREAQKAWRRADPDVRRGIVVDACPHTSPLAYNHPAQRAETISVFTDAARSLRG